MRMKLLLLAASLCWLNLSAVPVDSSGVRVFPEQPAPGVHPRVFITAGEKADLKHRLYDTEFGREAAARIMAKAREFMFNGAGKILQEIDLDAIDEEAVNKVFNGHFEGVSQYMGVIALEAWVNDDAALKQKAIKAAVTQAAVILKSKELMPEHRFWSTNDESGRTWTLYQEFVMGGVGLAASYDLLYNDMTEQERATIRKCISESITGKRSHGLGWPKTKLFSNWFPLHATMGVMMLSIEGEEGYDPEIYPLWRQGLNDWLEVGISENGANHEDGYVYYALRGGLSIFLAAERRGDEFAHNQRFRNMLKWQAMWEPAYGPLDGYQTFHAVTSYLYPNDPIANMFWARRVGESYERKMSWQSAFYTLLCGDDYQGTYANAVDYDQLDLPKSAFDKRRGVQIVRNGNGPDDLLFRMHARADSMFVGHAAVDSGSFELQALSREWVHHPVGDKVGSFNSYDNSIVHIDGIAQGMKPPAVNIIDQRDAGAATIITADLSYAYNWQWFYGWPMPGVEGRELPGAPWVPEHADPYKLGWPEADSWLPHDISNQPDLGFEGLWQMKKRINEVAYAFRTAIVARGEKPYVLIVDDVKKDDQSRLYEWYLATPYDLEFAGIFHNNIVLQESSAGRAFVADKGSKRLLVRMLNNYDMPEKNPYFYDTPTFIEGVKFGTHQSLARQAKNGTRYDVGTALFSRLDVPLRKDQGDFVVLLFPYETTVAGKDQYYEHPLGATELPETSWNADKTQLTVKVGEQTDIFTFEALESGQRKVTMTRNGKTVL